MTTLIACLSTGKGTWKKVNEIIDCENWERIILITNSFGKENFKGKGELLVFDFDKKLEELKKDIKQSLTGEKLGFEVALNIISGVGKEHMAIISALISLGVGFRLVYNEEGMKEL